MNDEYSDFVRGLMADKGDRTLNLVHAALGIAGESGEVVDIIKKNFAYGKTIDRDHLVEEIGDLLFYVQALCNFIGEPPELIAKKNMVKLSARFHKGTFSAEQAIAQADKNDAK
jgi:NTP pyrophosphatase (non-canonical NTP hydrolase)